MAVEVAKIGCLELHVAHRAELREWELPRELLAAHQRHVKSRFPDRGDFPQKRFLDWS
jgi:hypothetical protein